MVSFQMLDEEFPNVSFKKNFEDVMTEGEMWEWVDGPLTNAFHPPDLNETTEPQLLLETNALIGSLQVRLLLAAAITVATAAAAAAEAVMAAAARRRRRRFELNRSVTDSRYLPVWVFIVDPASASHSATMFYLYDTNSRHHLRPVHGGR